MFNKPNIFGRNDPLSRRDVPVLGTGSKSSLASANQNAGAVKEISRNSASTVVSTKPPMVSQAISAQPAVNEKVKDIDTVAELAGFKESSANENVMGARLIVGPEVKLKGAEILDCDTLVVEGRVDATMDSRVIRIAEKGSFSGKVSIDIAEIHGSFEGELTARSQLIIHKTGRVSGTIRYGKLVADEGCELCGDINVISENAVHKTEPVIEPFVSLTAAGR